MRKVFRFIAILAIGILAVSACSTPEATPTAVVEAVVQPTQIPTAVTPLLPEGQFIAFIIREQRDSYWSASRSAMHAKMAEFGFKGEFLGPEAENATTQQTIFNNVLSRKPAAIVFAPSDPDLAIEMIDQAAAAGVPVVTINTDSPNSKRIFYVGTDNEAAGYLAGKKFAEAIGGKGEIAIFHGSLGSVVDVARVNGFQRAITEFPGITIDTIIETIPPENSTMVPPTPEQILNTFPGLVGIFSIKPDITGLIGQALKDQQKCGKVVVYSYNLGRDGVNLMREGCVSAFVSEKPYTMTSTAINMLVDLIKGTKGQPITTDIGVELVTPDKLDLFLSGNN